jgi:hypothetical protein
MYVNNLLRRPISIILAIKQSDTRLKPYKVFIKQIPPKQENKAGLPHKASLCMI